MISPQRLRCLARASSDVPATALVRTTPIPVFRGTNSHGGGINNRLQQPQARLLSSSPSPSQMPTTTTAATTSHGRGTRRLPALFVRGGTSNGLVIRRSDLPPRQEDWDQVLPAAMGAPDPAHGLQLDGMGGGTSSTSKVCVLAPAAPERAGVADVDFTFVQVGVRDGALDVAGNCGNMSAAVGPVAWDEGLVGVDVGRDRGEVKGEGKGEGKKGGEDYREVTVRIFNTNTSKIIHSRFRVRGDGRPRYCPEGDYKMDGVPGTQSRITLSFIDPAGAKTGRALPTGNPVDELVLPDGGGKVRASLVDVSNPGVFVRVDEVLGMGGGDVGWLTPAAVESDKGLKGRLETIRREGARRMGLDPQTESVPKIVLLFPPEATGPGVDVRCLALSMGQAHKAVPLTLALCLGAAANMPGTIAAEVRGAAKAGEGGSSVVVGHPSGSVEIGATIEDGRIVSADLHRTARVLMKGEVYY
ncbi:methylitaconate delta2-delta3-isomerase [Biscogniauxia marginata]|nr:methylitaconate delta2-delta3-isomerase [Biscogniauxia marginata]